METSINISETISNIKTNEKILASITSVLMLWDVYGIYFSILIWIAYRKESKFIDKTCRNTINFTLFYAMIMIILGLIIWVSYGNITFNIVKWSFKSFYIVSAIKAIGGKVYKYPVSLDMV